MTNNRRLVFAALIAAGVLWGTTVPLSKLALAWLGPAWLAFARFGVAAAVLLLVAGRDDAGRAKVRAVCRPAVLASGAVGYGGSVLLQNLGIVHTSVTHAALIVGATPVIIAIITAVWQRTMARPVAWAGFAVSLVGVVLVASGKGGGATLGGDGLVLASQLISAGFTVAQGRLLRDRDPVAVTGVQFVAAAVAVLPIAVASEGAPVAPSSVGSLLAAAGLAFCGTVLPFTLFAYAQSRVAADVAGAFLNLEPLVGAAAGAVAFGDPVGLAQAAGGAAILIGIVLSSLQLRHAHDRLGERAGAQSSSRYISRISMDRAIRPRRLAGMSNDSRGTFCYGCGQMSGADVGMSSSTSDRESRGLTRLPFMLRVAVAVAVPALVLAACGTATPKAAPTLSSSHAAKTSASPTPSPTPKPKKHRHKAHAAHTSSPAASQSSPAGSGSGSRSGGGAPTASGCQSTFVPAYFYASSVWDQAINTRPDPTVMLLNVDNGVGTSPLSHFQSLVKQAQSAGITVLGYSSTEYGARSISSVESEINDYRSWYGVNGIFLDLTQGTSGEFSYYQTLANYVRSKISGGIVWLNPGSYPEPSFMSIANVVMVFEGSYSAYLSDQVPSWISQYSPSQFANVVHDTPQSDLASAINLSRRRRAGHLFVTDLSASGNPYGALPSYWSQEASDVSNGC